MKKFFIKIYIYFIIFSVMFFGVVIVLAFNATDDDTTTHYTKEQTVYDKDWVEARYGWPRHKVRYAGGYEVWKYSNSYTGEYTIFYFQDDIVVDYIQKKRTG